ncbi:MAG: alkaline phosphatase family protein [Deltaproteobacteria bacterium]
MRDMSEYFSNVTTGTLPSFSYVKFRTSENEHPAWSWISDGEDNATRVIEAIRTSPLYAANTLVILTWDEGGGFYDHVAPPAGIETFGPGTGAGFEGTPVPYGTRVPMIAIGRFARTGFVSHVGMEHSSIVAFVEWNFLGPSGVGAIRATTSIARDGIVNGIGSMLDPALVGAVAP